MKKIVLVFSASVFALLCAAQGKRIILSKGGDNGCVVTTTPYQPGDTFVLRASLNPWSYTYFGGINGTAQKPVVIINEGVVEMSAGIELENCRYVKLTGSGSRDHFGFKMLHSNGVALSIHGKSSDIDAERFMALDCNFGCWIKNEANCDTTINNWVLDHVSVHDYEFRDIRTEGFYMGSTDANNASRPVNCGGIQKFYRPSKLGNIKIYNGYINGTGRPAIQLSNAEVGMSEIYNNEITNVGNEGSDQQGTGISLGLYTRAHIHHNKIRNTLTWGIASLGGSGTLLIDHNIIDSSGHLRDHSINWAQNIVIDTRSTSPVDSTKFIITDNQVSNPGSGVSNIEIWQTLKTYSSDNLICGNTSQGKPAMIKVADGIRWRNCKVWQIATSSAGGSFPWRWVGGGAALLVVVVLMLRYRTR